MSTTRIFVNFAVEGIHRARIKFPKPDQYLSSDHRHQFHVYVEMQVYHDDREVEFIAFKRWLKNTLLGNFGPEPCQFGERSCEELARWLESIIRYQYGNERFLEIRVSEDNENGAILTS